MAGGLKHFYGDKNRAFDPHHGYVVMHLEKALHRFFSCMVAISEVETHCFSSTTNTEAGLNTKLFYVVHPIKIFTMTAR